MTLRGPTWVFGYGSLIWRQDFPYLRARPARVDGLERRFWQGSHDHRGTPARPGRVVTLIDSPGATCTGRAFLVEPGVFRHLDHREKNGYQRRRIRMTIDDRQESGLTYFAGPGNPAFLGDAPPETIARQIARCSGPSGSNLEYLLELAAALRDLGAEDPHVFELETLLRQ
jgi:cation transport protein ChaC